MGAKNFGVALNQRETFFATQWSGKLACCNLVNWVTAMYDSLRKAQAATEDKRLVLSSKALVAVSF